jgi:phage gp45-like
MSVKSPFHGSETQVGQVGGKTTRFLIVVFRICHSEKRCG